MTVTRTNSDHHEVIELGVNGKGVSIRRQPATSNDGAKTGADVQCHGTLTEDEKEEVRQWIRTEWPGYDHIDFLFR